MDTELIVKKWWSAPKREDDGADESCVAHTNQRTVSERFYRDHGDSASKYPSKYMSFQLSDVRDYGYRYQYHKMCSVSDPDWIRIQSGQWIRIQITDL
jgi:hypothetical protein